MDDSIFFESVVAKSKLQVTVFFKKENPDRKPGFQIQIAKPYRASSEPILRLFVTLNAPGTLLAMMFIVL